jgi:hypothetical protein
MMLVNEIGMQGEVAHLSLDVTKHHRSRSSTLMQMLESSKQSSPSPTIHQLISQAPIGGRLSRRSSRSPSPNICGKFESKSHKLEQIQEQTKNPIPLTKIMKPYMHDGSVSKHMSIPHQNLAPSLTKDAKEH